MCWPRPEEDGVTSVEVKALYEGPEAGKWEASWRSGKANGQYHRQTPTYYGNAIRAHPNDIRGMGQEVWAGLFHRASSDKSLNTCSALRVSILGVAGSS